MTESPNILNLDNLQSLFKDAESFEQFTRLLQSSMQNDLRPIVANNKVIGAILSSKGTQDVLYDRMVRCITERPDLLDELARRVESDEIVDEA